MQWFVQCKLRTVLETIHTFKTCSRAPVSCGGDSSSHHYRKTRDTLSVEPFVHASCITSGLILRDVNKVNIHRTGRVIMFTVL